MEQTVLNCGSTERKSMSQHLAVCEVGLFKGYSYLATVCHSVLFGNGVTQCVIWQRCDTACYLARCVTVCYLATVCHSVLFGKVCHSVLFGNGVTQCVIWQRCDTACYLATVCHSMLFGKVCHSVLFGNSVT